MLRCLLPVLLACTATSAVAATYPVDPVRTQVSFSVRGPAVMHADGVVAASSGQVVFDPAQLQDSQVAVDLDMRHLTTGFSGIDAWLRGRGGFDVADFPTARFSSTQVIVDGGNQAHISGDLTLHGITRPVTILARLMPSQDAADGVEFVGEGQVKRSDFNVRAMPFVSNIIALKIVVKTFPQK